jgi:RNA polymerase sigma-70 factor (ECF subfamily)
VNRSPESDEELARLARQGDKRAFEALVRRYKDRLYRLIRHYTGLPDDAYDILQDSFIAAWGALSRYDPSRPFLPWLQTIALNKCRDFARRGSVRRAFLKVFSSAPALVPEPSEEEADADSALADRLNRLDRAIAALPALYKEPLLLTVAEGLSHQEVAAILKTSPKAIEMRLYRARHRLAQMMGDPGGEG